MRELRNSGKVKGPMTPIEKYEYEIKGKRCHEFGIPVLVDDNIKRSEMGCKKYGIELINPLDLI
jgi:predicted P-loop ATPase/GTPase